MTAHFITGAGTDVGKTLVTMVLCRQLRARGAAVRALKPVATGFTAKSARTSDTGLLLAALGLKASRTAIDAVSPWRFKEPLSPDMAAAREGKSVDFDKLVGFCREAILAAKKETLLIEGIGGVMVPLDDKRTVRDWIAALSIPAIVVTGSYLGSLSHTLSAVEALRGRGVVVAAVVVSESEGSAVPLAATVTTLTSFLPGIRLVALPRLKDYVEGKDAPDLTGLVRALWA